MRIGLVFIKSVDQKIGKTFKKCLQICESQQETGLGSTSASRMGFGS